MTDIPGRLEALQANSPIYYDTCTVHGFSIYNTADSSCATCAAALANLPPATRAILQRKMFYREICPVHGKTDYYTKGQRCASCFTRKGKPIPRNERKIARVAGERGYLEWCVVHGAKLHSTHTGRCHACAELEHPRARARMKGAKTYLFDCVRHGETAFSVRVGSCLTCCTHAGVPRVVGQRIAEPSTDRAKARYAGRSTYQAGCPFHGTTAFSVTHGKCLTCFTTGGVVRKTMPRV